MSKKVVIRDPLLKKVNTLPEVIVTLIGDFLPDEVVYAIKIKDLKKPGKLLDSCSSCLKTLFLLHFSNMREFLSLLSFEDAKKEAIDGEVHFAHGSTSGKIIKSKILQMIDIAKDANPKFAYKMLTTIISLIDDPSKKYRSNLSGFDFHKKLTMDDVLAVHA